MPKIPPATRSLVVAAGVAVLVAFAPSLSAQTPNETPGNRTGPEENVDSGPPPLVLEGADVPLLFCVEDFLTSRRLDGLVRNVLVGEADFSRAELVRLTAARIQAKEAVQKVQDDYRRRIREFEHLEYQDPVLYGEKWDQAGFDRYRRVALAIADAYVGLRADLDATSARGLDLYLKPPRCGGVVASLMVGSGKRRQELLETDIEFERLVGEVER